MLWGVSPSCTLSLDLTIGRYAILSLLQRSRPHSPEFRAPRNFFIGSARRLFMRNGLLCISALQFFTRVFFLLCNFLTPCRNEVLVALRPNPMLGANKTTDSTALAFVDSSKWSHSPGTSGLRNAKRCAPVRRSWNECTCVLTSGKPLFVTMRRRRLCKDDFFFSYICERSCFHARCRLMIEVLINRHQHAHNVLELTCIWGRWPLSLLSPARRSSVQPDYDG